MRLHHVKAAAFFLLVVLLLGLCACSGASGKFEVEYVGATSLMAPEFFIVGDIGNKSTKLNIEAAFKDCTITGVNFPENITFRGTDGGLLSLDGGIILTLKDSNENYKEVTIKEGNVYDTVREGDTFYLVLPE